jgi:GGDEF domain-containing protein
MEMTAGMPDDDRKLTALTEKTFSAVPWHHGIFLGDDDLVVRLESDLDADTPEFIASRIGNAFAQGFTLGQIQIESGASIGISRFPVDGKDADQLMASADRAMYRAKHSR